MWRVRFVLSVCSLVMTRENLCVRFLNELLVVRLSFVVKLFMLRSWFRSFRVEILVSLLYSISRISNSCFRVEIRISNSYFEVVFSFRCSIRLLEFRFFDSSFEFEYLDFSSSNFSSYFRFVALFDFSNFDFSIRASSSSTSISRVRISRRIFVSLLYSTSRISIRNCRRNFDSKAQFSIATINWRLSSILARTLALRSRCHSSAARAFRA